MRLASCALPCVFVSSTVKAVVNIMPLNMWMSCGGGALTTPTLILLRHVIHDPLPSQSLKGDGFSALSKTRSDLIVDADVLSADGRRRVRGQEGDGLRDLAG